ncbi:MAG TPA: AAA family ATPase [Candidatus Omnitrophota bacterium]|nr:AAA family ATPase [Candidatus Omnitrophota bacterium]HQL40899.1 AAA family ATPase [Candidatus Omnitrophota bacterium]
MYLKRVEIFGFKSFADKTVLNFEPGITAVVGPNGCGKSNVFDAIRWVLGEQSMKELRGSNKEDVIFSGTNQRQPLNFAEVSLTFSNENKIFPIEYDEVTVSRRLFRSGESEYLLNKTPVRLKDILELLMGTGVGAEAYSLVQQGKVDLVVSARPDDRRLIFDEAAGITKYKAKKREALNKLEDVENNLLRSNDIITEVKRQIASIERQAKKAQKYKEEHERLKVLEFFAAQKHITNFNQERQDLENSLQSYQKEESLLGDELEKLNHQLAEENRLVSELDEKANELQRENIKLENQIEIESRQIHFNEERIANIDTDHLRHEEQKVQLKERCRGQEEKVLGLKASYQNLVDSIQKNTQELDLKKELLNSLQEQIHQHKSAIKQEEEAIFERSTKQTHIKNDLTEIMKSFQSSLARKRRLDFENDKVGCEKEDVDNKLRSVSEDIDRCSEKIADLRAEKETYERSWQQLKEAMAVLEKTISDLENLKLALRSKREFIEDLRAQYETGSDVACQGSLLTAQPPTDDKKGIIGKIRSVEGLTEDQVRGLGERFVSLANGQSVYEIKCETKFIELDPEQITNQINELTAEVDRHLEQKAAMVAQMTEVENQVSRVGVAIHEQERELSRHEARKNNILEESSKLFDELNIITQELQETKDSLTHLKSREDALTQELNTATQEIEAFQATIKGRQDEIAIKGQEREHVLLEITQLETQIDSYRGQEQSFQGDLKMFEDALIESAQELKRVEDDDQNDQAKRGEYQASIAHLRQKIADVQIKQQELASVLTTYVQQKEEIFARIADVRVKVKSVQSALEQIQGNAHAQELKKQEITFNEQSLKDKLFQAYKVDFDELVNYREPDPVLDEMIVPEAVASALTSDELLAQQKHQEDVKAFHAKITAARAEISFDQIDQDIQSLRKHCESFGTVNLVAIEEYEELRQRFEFLTKQQSDLLQAKDSLMQTINKINKTTRQLFVDTFTKVSEEFRIYFRMLFGGGEADLILVDQENVLESGIDIVARPPGKKLQNIGLLSGGEKTMTAIALIFAVFKVKPSPFCVLDEIDAALDESNVGRYSYLLQEFSKIAQFIVITHNKKTINCANVMYGVTMQERGVSKIVSVRLSDEEKEVEKEVPVPAAV